METQIALWMWIAAAAFFVTGLLLGVALSRSHETATQRVKERVKELESELQQSREESTKYREQVAHHFMQTADLVHTMTANYRAIYEHLADGAQVLCAGQVRTLTPAALRERLLPADHDDITPVEHGHPPHSSHAEIKTDQKPSRGENRDTGEAGKGAAAYDEKPGEHGIKDHASAPVHTGESAEKPPPTV